MTLEWKGCYSTSPKNYIPDEAYNHPARMRVRLLENILAYGNKNAFWKPGDWLLDPMGGIGMTAAIGCRAGYNVELVEIEPYFFDIVAGCWCSGISKPNWANYFGRWRKVAYRDPLHWCPRCLEGIGDARANDTLALFEALQPSPSYARNSGIVPSSLSHCYDGTLDMLDRSRRREPTIGHAIAHFGDARKLTEILVRPLDGAVFSPPYFGSLASDDPDKRGGLYRDPKRRNDRTLTATYGASPGQVGAMSEGLFEDICAGIEAMGEIDYDIHDTYWAAMAQVYQGLFKVLKPGALVAIVVRHLIKKGEVLDLPAMTLRLLNAIGFATIDEARAMLTEKTVVGFDIEGNEISKTTEHKTFHRLNYERKFPNNRIDFETVLFVRKAK